MDVRLGVWAVATVNRKFKGPIPKAPLKVFSNIYGLMSMRGEGKAEGKRGKGEGGRKKKEERRRKKVGA